MGLALSVLPLIGLVKKLQQWYEQIHGNWLTYLRLVIKQQSGHYSNKRFELYDLNKRDDPRHLSLIPFEEEWQLDCPSKSLPENLFIYGANSSGQVVVLQIIWRPVNEQLVQVKVRLTLKETESILTTEQNSTLRKADLVDQDGHISSFRIGALLIQISHPFSKLRICFRGFLTSKHNDQVHFARLNFLWACLGQVHDFQNNYNASFMMQQFAAQGHTNLERENRFEQWGQLKGTIKLENEQLRHIFLWGVKAKYEPLARNTKCARLWAYNTKGVGFHLGSVQTKQFSYKYGYVNMGTGLNKNIVDVNLNRESIEIMETLEHGECLIDVGSPDKLCRTVTEGPYEQIADNIWLCPMNINSHKAMGLFIKEQGTDLALDVCESRSISAANSCQKTSHSTELVLPIDHQCCTHRSLAGGKGSSLAELMQYSTKCATKFTVPNGLVITTAAYDLYIQQNRHLQNIITSFETTVRTYNDTLSVKKECARLKAEFEKCSLPNIVANQLLSQLAVLFEGYSEFSKKMFAVRSSSVSEDSADMSCAGQMTTFLGVTTLSAIQQSVIKCWASQFSHEAIEYKRGYGQPLNGPMAVVVQEMVHCDQAGVIFTCDPVSGNERYLTITANYGLGESVVGSLSDPDTIQVEVDIETNNAEQARQVKGIKQVTIGAKTKCIRVGQKACGVQEEIVPLEKQRQCCLNKEQITALSNVALGIHHYYDEVSDIEFGLTDGQVFILQSRPVANLYGFTEWEIMHEMDTGQNSEMEVFSRANLGEVFPNASSYICLSWLLNFWKAFSHVHWKNIGNVEAQDYVPYYNVGFGVAYNTTFFNLKSVAFAFGGDKKLPFTQGIQLGMFGHEIPDEVLLDSLERMPPKNQSLLNKAISAAKFASLVFGSATKNRKLQKRFAQFKLPIDQECATSTDLFYALGHQLNHIFLPYTNHLTVTVVSMLYNALLYTFIQSNNKSGNKCLDDFSQIVSSAQNVVSAKVPFLLNAIARKITNKQEFLAMSDENAQHYLMTSMNETANEFRALILEFGHRGYKEFDVYSLQWEDNMTTLVQSLKAMISKNNDENLGNHGQETNEMASQLPLVKRLLLRHVFTPLSQHGIRLREQGKDLLTKSLHQYRKVFWQLANRLAEEGKIPDRELLFFMTFAELGQVVKMPNAAIVAHAKMRKQYHPKKERFRFAETTYGPDIKPRNLEPGLNSTQFSGECRHKGVPVSSGKVIARCCVAASLEDAKHLQKGDILVTFSTDIGWSPYFVALSGLVTEIGGLISHGAVIAREYGLPGLVGVENAMEAFKTGDIVLLDTENGEIVKLDSLDKSQLELAAI